MSAPEWDPHEHLAAVRAGMQAVFERDPSSPGWIDDAMRLAFLVEERPVPPQNQLEASFDALSRGSPLASLIARGDASAIRFVLRERLVRAGFIG